MTITPTAALGGYQRLVAREPDLLEGSAHAALSSVGARDDASVGSRARQAGTRRRAGRQSQPSATIRALHRAGARIIAGVDSPLVPYGISLHGELEDYVAAGLTPFQALQTATVNPARLLAAGRRPRHASSRQAR